MTETAAAAEGLLFAATQANTGRRHPNKADRPPPRDPERGGGSVSSSRGRRSSATSRSATTSNRPHFSNNKQRALFRPPIPHNNTNATHSVYSQMSNTSAKVSGGKSWNTKSNGGSGSSPATANQNGNGKANGKANGASTASSSAVGNAGDDTEALLAALAKKKKNGSLGLTITTTTNPNAKYIEMEVYSDSTKGKYVTGLSQIKEHFLVNFKTNRDAIARAYDEETGALVLNVANQMSAIFSGDPNVISRTKQIVDDKLIFLAKGTLTMNNTTQQQFAVSIAGLRNVSSLSSVPTTWTADVYTESSTQRVVNEMRECAKQLQNVVKSINKVDDTTQRSGRDILIYKYRQHKKLYKFLRGQKEIKCMDSTEATNKAREAQGKAPTDREPTEFTIYKDDVPALIAHIKKTIYEPIEPYVRPLSQISVVVELVKPGKKPTLDDFKAITNGSIAIDGTFYYDTGDDSREKRYAGRHNDSSGSGSDDDDDDSANSSDSDHSPRGKVTVDSFDFGEDDKKKSQSDSKLAAKSSSSPSSKKNGKGSHPSTADDELSLDLFVGKKRGGDHSDDDDSASSS